MSERIRSFLAFDMDSQTVVRKITEIQAALVKTGADLKPVEPQNIHVTIRFLGEILSGTVDKVFEEMKKTQFVPFNIKIHGVGVFPTINFPRVVWAGITDGANQLQSIFTQLEPRLQTLGFSPDPKGFSPHLTIARVRSARNKPPLAKFVSENPDFEFGIIRAACLKLKKSELTPRGPIYSTLKEFCP
ncbi:RNA 2',3'-cyclic phosphodiesterase [Candidatus Bathyarchaeota archaeon]|jgi:2'-5' RNA ligase|nr:RNA 2',3'-cyclic phosphodiesterase [Candidatus Bathyarchaeota archaeon]